MGDAPPVEDRQQRTELLSAASGSHTKNTATAEEDT
jgi:hypothetical protein